MSLFCGGKESAAHYFAEIENICKIWEKQYRSKDTASISGKGEDKKLKIEKLLTKLREQANIEFIDIVIILLIAGLIIMQVKICEQSQINDRLISEFQNNIYTDLENMNYDAERILGYKNP